MAMTWLNTLSGCGLLKCVALIETMMSVVALKPFQHRLNFEKVQ